MSKLARDFYTNALDIRLDLASNYNLTQRLTPYALSLAMDFYYLLEENNIDHAISVYFILLQLPDGQIFK